MKLNRIISSALIFVMLFASIVAAIPVTGFASEEAEYKVSVLENDTRDEKAVKEIYDTYLTYGFGELNKFKFKTVEDCLQYELSMGYLDSVEYGDHAIYVNRYTGLMYYVNHVTGQILTSNPIDPAYAATNPNNIVSVGDAYGFLSQLELQYFHITDSQKVETLYTLTEIMDGAPLLVTKLSNGLSVKYILGEATDGFIASGAVEAEDFKTNIAYPIFNTLAALMEQYCGEFDAEFAKTVKAQCRANGISVIKDNLISYDVAEQSVYNKNELRTGDIPKVISELKEYAKIKLADSHTAYTQIVTYADNASTVLREYTAMIPEVLKENDAPAGYNSAIDYYAETFPILKEGNSVYSLRINDINTLRVIDRAMKQVLPNYTLDMVKEDHDVVGFVSEYEEVASFKVTVNYTLDENGALVVDIPVNAIQFNEEVFAIKQITPLKYFGAADMNNDGYVFFPDGSGTIIEYSDFYFDESSGKTNTNMSVSGKVYGPDYCYTKITGAHREQITMPVWGMTAEINSNETSKQITSNDISMQGFLAVIEKGSSLATLGVATSPATHKYAYSYASFSPFLYDACDLSQALSVSGLKSYTMVADGRYSGSIVTKYTMLVDETLGAKLHANGGDEYYAASYIGMVVCYRDSLIAAGVLDPLTDTYDELPLYIEALGSIDVMKKILSFPVTVSTPLTTFEDVERMYKELSDAQAKLLEKANEYKTMADELTRKEDESLKAQYLANYEKYKALSEKVKNIKNVNFRLNGFANGGMSFTYPSKVKLESSVGGKRGFKKLLAYADSVNEKGNYNLGIYLDFDFQYISNTAAFDGITQNKDAARMVDNRFATQQSYDSVSQEYTKLKKLLLSSSSLDKLYKKFDKQYTKLGTANLSVSTLGSDLNSNLDEDNLIDRESALNNVTALLSKMSSDYSLMTNKGNMYSIKYMDHIIGISTDSSHFKYSSYTIPFIGMVLHGFVSYSGSALNYSGSPDYDILRSIESGASLYYILCCENTNYLKEDPVLSSYFGISYENWFEKIAEQYTKLDDAIGTLQQYHIVDHKIILAERVIERSEMEKNYARLAAEYSEAIERELVEAIDKAIKENRTDGNGYKGVALNVDIESIVEDFAEKIHVDDESTLANMKAIVDLDPEKIEIDDTVLKYNYDADTDTWEMEIEIESYISANLLAVLAVVNDYRSQYPTDSGAVNYGENPRTLDFTGENVDYESLYSYVTDSYATEENYDHTDFTCDNSNIVMVTYRHPETGHEVKFILNYNNFAIDVRLAKGEKPITLDAYAYYPIGLTE